MDWVCCLGKFCTASGGVGRPREQGSLRMRYFFLFISSPQSYNNLVFLFISERKLVFEGARSRSKILGGDERPSFGTELEC